MSKEEILQAFNTRPNETLMDTLKIRYTDVGDDFLVATMPVTPAVHQPFGLLHGGATAALVESVGSAASALHIDRKNQMVVGIEISCNHLKSKREGQVTATAKAIHLGKTTHLWEILVKDEEGRLISHCKLTNMVLDRK
jgi:uncharacterized protein (TIGR00369 family)